MIERIRAEIEESIVVKQALLDDTDALERVRRLSKMCVEALRAGGKVIFAGNGGSFADAQHLAAEFVSRFRFDRQPLAAIALGTNNSVLTAIGNDYGYERVFSREIAACAGRRDVFIPISTSGNSGNILAAVETAKQLGIALIGLTGRSGGQLADACECVRVPSDDTARIQECHITIGHVVCGLVEATYFAQSVRVKPEAF